MIEVYLRENLNPHAAPYVVTYHEPGMLAHYRESYETLEGAMRAIQPASWMHPDDDADNDVLFVAQI